MPTLPDVVKPKPGATSSREQGSRGAARPPRTRDRLLDAAAALFAERGYRVVTLDDIGGAVGISGRPSTATSRAKRASSASCSSR